MADEDVDDGRATDAAPAVEPEPNEPVPNAPHAASHVDVAGAVLVVVGIVGAAGWAWDLVRAQTARDDADVVDRLDLIVEQTPVLLLAGLVAGLGVALRTTVAARTGAPARTAFGRPVGWMVLGVAAVLGAFLGGVAIIDDGDEDDSIARSAWEDIGRLDEPLVERRTPTIPTPAPSETYTLEVHGDGCGVIRSGEIGDDLTWVVTDGDGFQVLGRNAAGETRYRYFRPGTYTVVLEAWNGGFYAPVSNEVTITC